MVSISFPRVLFSLLWLLCVCSSFSQRPLQVIWTRTNPFDYPYGYILPTPFGYVSGGSGLHSAGSAWIELDSEATAVNFRRVGHGPEEEWRPTLDGFLRVHRTANGSGQSNNILSKVSFTGRTEWTNFVGLSTTLTPEAVLIPLPNGRCIVVPPAGDRFFHFGADGALLFQSPSTEGRIRDVVVTPAGYYAAGVQDFDFMIWAVGTNGLMRWKRKDGGYKLDEATRIVYSESEQALYVAGRSLSDWGNNNLSNKSAPSHGESDFWLVKVRTNGDKVWDAAFGGKQAEEFPDMALVGSDIVLAGRSASHPDGVFRTSEAMRGAGVDDLWCVVVDQDGKKRGELSLNYVVTGDNQTQVNAMANGDILLRHGAALHRIASPTRITVSLDRSHVVVLPGRTITLNATPYSLYGPLKYQWVFNDTPIAGATNASLEISAFAAVHAGRYHVVVRNPFSEGRSLPAQLTLTEAEIKLRMLPSLEIQGFTGREYIVERTLGGASTVWEVADRITLTNAVHLWVDTSLSLSDSRFYRVTPAP